MLVLVGLVSFMLAMVVLGLSESVTMVFVSGLVGIGSKLVDSVLRALVSQVSYSLTLVSLAVSSLTRLSVVMRWARCLVLWL